MQINKWLFEFHLLDQGWLSTPPSRGDSSKSQPPSESNATLRMVEVGSDDKPDIWYKAEVAHIGSNRAKLTALIGQHGLPKAILVNCWAQKQELEQQLCALD